MYEWKILEIRVNEISKSHEKQLLDLDIKLLGKSECVYIVGLKDSNIINKIRELSFVEYIDIRQATMADIMGLEWDPKKEKNKLEIIKKLSKNKI